VKSILNFVISGFCCEVDEDRVRLGYYAMCSGKSLPMFWDNLSVLSSRVKNRRRRRENSWILDPCRWDWYTAPDMLVRNNHYVLHNSPEEHSSRTLNLPLTEIMLSKVKQTKFGV